MKDLKLSFVTAIKQLLWYFLLLLLLLIICNFKILNIIESFSKQHTKTKLDTRFGAQCSNWRSTDFFAHCCWESSWSRNRIGKKKVYDKSWFGWININQKDLNNVRKRIRDRFFSVSNFVLLLNMSSSSKDDDAMIAILAKAPVDFVKQSVHDAPTNKVSHQSIFLF